MDMHVFQIESEKKMPQKGDLLIASPFIGDYQFSRSLVLLIEHNEEGSMGLALNKEFSYHLKLNDLIRELKSVPPIPVYKGGPMDRDTLFFLHTFHNLKGALPLGNGVYLNGDFETIQQYILEGNPIDGVVRFFAGYAGWEDEQLVQEIKENAWFVGKVDKKMLFEISDEELWRTRLSDMGWRQAIWARYPQFPALN